jgi:uncharacterized membrane protein
MSLTELISIIIGIVVVILMTAAESQLFAIRKLLERLVTLAEIQQRERPQPVTAGVPAGYTPNKEGQEKSYGSWESLWPK